VAPVRRLRERLLVQLARAEQDGRTRLYGVVAVDARGVALYPVAHDPRDTGEPEGEHFLVFDHGGRPVVLRGLARTLGHNDVRFAPTDGVELPRRAAVRLEAQTPIEISDVAEERRGTQTTVDYSADGALLDDPGFADVGDAVRFSFAPDGGAAIAGTATVVRRDDGLVALAFDPLDAAAGERLIEHVIAAKRDELEREVQRRLAALTAAAAAAA
jgi:hypothetical protein